jgi:hypothetical protein
MLRFTIDFRCHVRAKPGGWMVEEEGESTVVPIGSFLHVFTAMTRSREGIAMWQGSGVSGRYRSVVALG